jgi:hypothetical protein
MGKMVAFKALYSFLTIFSHGLKQQEFGAQQLPGLQRKQGQLHGNMAIGLN